MFFSWFIFILVIIIDLAIFFALLAKFFSLASRAPYIGTPRECIPHIVTHLGLKNGDIFYDLGCGDARVLMACAKSTPLAKHNGIEYSWYPYLLAKNNLRNLPVKVVRESFYKTDLSNATHIYTYLMPSVMDDLLPKMTRELKSGAKVFSLDFKFKDKKPTTVIDLGPKFSRGRHIYIYEF